MNLESYLSFINEIRVVLWRDLKLLDEDQKSADRYIMGNLEYA